MVPPPLPRRVEGKDEPDPWATIEEALKKLAEFEKLYNLLERGDAFSSELLSWLSDTRYGLPFISPFQVMGLPLRQLSR